MLKVAIQSLKQQDNESDRAYVDRAHDLFTDYNLYGRTVDLIMDAKEYVQFLRRGFRNYESMSQYLKSRSAWDDPKEMRRIITEDHNETLVAMEQQGRNLKTVHQARTNISGAPSKQYELKSGLTEKGSRIATCKCGMFGCESSKLGWCPDCYICGYMGHRARNHTAQLQEIL